MILDDKFIGSDADVERIILAPAMTFDLSLLLRAEIGENLEGWAPLFEFHLPINDDSGRHYNQMRAPYSLITGQRSKHRYGLNRFSKAHLISEDTIQLLIMQGNKPVQTDNLILSQGAVKQEGDFGLNISAREVSTSWLKTFCHFDGLLGN